MFIFFLIINLVFAAVFYFFYDVSGRYYESVFFLIAGFLFFFFFSPFYLLWSKKEDKVESKTRFFEASKQTIKKIIPNTQKLLYFGAFLLFYTSVYGIFYSYDIDFRYFISGTSHLFFILFFVGIFYLKKDTLSYLFRTNTIIFSIYILWVCLKYFVDFYSKAPVFDGWFLYHGIFYLLSGISILVYDVSTSFNIKKIIYQFYLVYLFLLLTFFINTFFIYNIHITLVLLGVVYSIVLFEYSPKIKYFNPYSILSKYFGLLLNFGALLYGSVLVCVSPPYFNYNIIILLLIGGFFQWFVHKKFENYFSYITSLWVLVLLYIKTFMLYESDHFFFYFLFITLFPGLAIGYSYLVEKKHNYDYYFLHYLSILVSIWGIIYYFIIKGFSSDIILPTSIFFLVESAFFFLSYIKLKNK